LPDGNVEAEEEVIEKLQIRTIRFHQMKSIRFKNGCNYLKINPIDETNRLKKMSQGNIQKRKTRRKKKEKLP
jgi:hypothetical protein